jgi:hypothetical protein
MPANKLDKELRRAITASLKANGNNKSETARELGISRSTVARYCPEEFKKDPSVSLGHATPDKAPQADNDFVRKGDDNSQQLTFKSPRPIRTVEDALKYAEVDTTVWRVVHFEVNSYEVGMKLRTFTDDQLRPHVRFEKPHVEHLWQVKLKIERILPKSHHDALEALFDKAAKYAPKYPKLVTPRAPKRPHLMVVDLHDTHFGKLAYAKESGQDYDLKIAENLYRNAVKDLLDKAAGYEVEEFLVPIGSDFLHVDNLTSSTTSGTPVDSDGRTTKIISVGVQSAIWAIEYMAARGRVQGIRLPGNHDYLLSYCIARELAAWFRNCPQVTVDFGEKSRKYYRYHSTLLGLAHGNEEKIEDLPGLMAVEAPQDWAAATCREYHIGHWHKSKQFKFVPLDTYKSVTVRVLRSLSAVDAWHYNKGFVGGPRAAEAYLYDHNGLSGMFNADARSG